MSAAARPLLPSVYEAVAPWIGARSGSSDPASAPIGAVVTELLALGGLAMIAADAVVGVRLLGLARRTRALPEATLGVAFLLLGVIGYPLATAARRGVLGDGAGNAALLGGGILAQDVACLALYVHVARTFRAGTRAADAIAALAGCLLAATWVGQAARDGFAPDANGAAYLLGIAARAGAFGWAAFESLRCHRLARRRLRLGLADPVVTDRFALFGVAATAVFAAFAVFLLGRLVHAGAAEATWVLATSSAAGLVAAVAMWLAFVPPGAYLRRVAARAPAAG